MLRCFGLTTSTARSDLGTDIVSDDGHVLGGAREGARASKILANSQLSWFRGFFRKRNSRKSPSGSPFGQAVSASSDLDPAVEEERPLRPTLSAEVRQSEFVPESKSLSVRRGLGKLTISQADLEVSSFSNQVDEYGASFCNWDDGALTSKSYSKPSTQKFPKAPQVSETFAIDPLQSVLEKESTLAAQAALNNITREHPEVPHSLETPSEVQTFASEPAPHLDARNLRFIRLIGSGSFASVQLALYKDSKEPIAIKVMDSNSYRFQAQSEVVILRLAREYGCKNIVYFHGSVEEGGHMMILMEHMDIGSIDTLYRRSLVKRLPETVVRAIAWQTLRALQFVHFVCHRVHRDVKPSNLLINRRGEVKLADFGLSSSSSSQTDSQREIYETGPQASLREGKFVGTCLYMAPEMLRASPYDTRADIYSLGISLLECVLGKNPNYEDYLSSRGHLDLIMTLLEKGPPGIPGDVQISANARDFFSLCLEADYNRRPFCPVLLGHRWFDLLKIPRSTTPQRTGSLSKCSARFSNEKSAADIFRDRMNTMEFEDHLRGDAEGHIVSSLSCDSSKTLLARKLQEIGDDPDSRSNKVEFRNMEDAVADENARNELVSFLHLLGLISN
ncbi:hypothetical protein F1559_003065 [Cyanidiococcus yangmingshanensis]|uniref:mitogen-activated protein kinase kinase n=1 Tax=Cyanidiococcus yangmingshanensis TaxID=2690220 RepID=A0A7J7IQ39_9RHOD|nr:hypothetical protein F1559_003065 [Cyanidiococcus yangmingshanensis]